MSDSENCIGNFSICLQAFLNSFNFVLCYHSACNTMVSMGCIATELVLQTERWLLWTNGMQNKTGGYS